MEIRFTSEAIKDLEQWKKSGNNKILKRIRLLLEVIQQTPFSGIGKPESLKYDLAGKWSRRIYSVTDTTIYIHSIMGHYE
jgi:toxin YoeB